MTSVKVKFKPSTVAGREGTIYYQIIQNKKVRQLFTEYHVFPDEWDTIHGKLLTNKNSERLAQLSLIRAGVCNDVERLKRIALRLAAGNLDYTSDDIIEEFHRYSEECSLFNFMGALIINLKLTDRLRTSETYRTTLNSFKRFRQDKDVMLDTINGHLMESYEAWLKAGGVVQNTSSFYMRILRAVYNRAVEGELIENRYPFRRVYTGIDKTVKRALPYSAIKQIKALDLSLQPLLDYARDMFMMSFYLRGMSFVDMAYLKKSDLKDGYITYHRRKTGQRLIIAWESEMQQLLDKYPNNESEYLMPIIKRSDIDGRRAYKNTAYKINVNLKKIAAVLGLKIPLTLYVARHSWATAAKTHGVPIRVISEGMGHDSETTTQIYLASLDTSAVDMANSSILKGLSI